MNNNMMLLLLPFLLGGKNKDMTGALMEILKSQQGGMNPMTLLMLSMLSGSTGKKSCDKEGTEAVKDFGGVDVVKVLQILLNTKNQSKQKGGTKDSDAEVNS